MNLLPTDEQNQMVAAFRQFLTGEFPISRLRERIVRDLPIDDEDWSSLAMMGLFGLGLPKTAGGAGYGIVEETLAFRELGRQLVPGPLLATVLAGHLAVDHGQSDLAVSLAAGQARVAIAEPFRDGDAAVGDSVTGTFRVLDGPASTYVLVVDDDRFALLGAGVVGSWPDQLDAMDLAVPTCIIELNDAETVLSTTHTPLRDLGRVLVAAMQCGVAEQARDESAEYAKTREQFGQPIGAFQAVKHRCADQATRCEAAWCETAYAALVVAGANGEGAFHGSAAKLLATTAAVDNAADDVQNHGGMGFTHEVNAHLYLRRARLLEQVLGSRPAISAAMLASRQSR